MSALRDILLRQIEIDGPMSVAAYMQTCLLHPEHGYYTTRDPFGVAGDFTTAPEISQMFGELLGLSLAQSWMDQGAPEDAILVELGPGRGTLMRDMLRAGKAAGFGPEVHLIEASGVLRDMQRDTLDGTPITFHETTQTLPSKPLFFIANEFFDALPVRQFIRSGDGWSERLIGAQDGALAFGLSAPAPLADLEGRLGDTKDGDLVEICAQAGPIMADLTAQITAHGGAGIVVDYGDWRALGDTFQAVKSHEKTDPLSAPGTADLTAHVAFEALANAATCPSSQMVPQGVLLERLGITARAQALAETLSGEALASHIAAHRRLTHSQEMGQLFKAIAFAATAETLPAGFEPCT